MTMVAPPALRQRLDLAKCMRLALIHDLAESLVGDLTPLDGVPKPEKSRREASTIHFISKELLGKVHEGDTEAGEQIRAEWLEFEAGATLEAQFVQDIDKVELLLQTIEYERRGQGKLDLSQFTYVATKLALPEMKAWADSILRERERFWAGQGSVHGNTAQSVSQEMRTLVDQYYDGK